MRCSARPFGRSLDSARCRAAKHATITTCTSSNCPIACGKPSFRKANPDYRLGKPLVYVGMTGLDPDLRFDKHKAGIQANRFVREYGLRLLPHLYDVDNPMPYDAAREMEVELAIGLREAGYGVWQA